MVSEAQKKANQKWDAAHMSILSCKVRKEQAELFKKACDQYGTSPNEIFRTAMQEFLATHPVTEDI